MTNILDTTKRRLSYYLNSKNITITKFFAETGIKRGFLDSDKMDKTVTDENLNKILSVYRDLDPTWLISGEGNMIKYQQTVPIEEADSLDHEVNILSVKLEMMDQMIKEKESTIQRLNKQIEERDRQFNDQLAQKDAQITQLLQIISSK